MLISTSVQNIIALVHRGSYRQDKLTLHQASPLEDVPWLRLGICLLGAGKGKKQTKFPIEVRTLKQEREIDDDYATMRESFKLVQKILFGAFGATSFLGWSWFPGDSNMCCFGRRSDCNTLGIIHREEHGFWEHCKIYTCWKFENHSFPLVCYTTCNIYQFGKFIWRKMTNEKDGLTTLLQCQSVKMSWRHNL